jgi:bacterioferritin (cytochrome b1)
MDSVKNSLHFMYYMERFATEVYRTQRGAFGKSKLADEFMAATENEHEHAESLRKRVIEIRGVPARMGFLFQLAGIILGILTRIFGKHCMFRADILVEKRAIKDYDSFVSRIDFDEQTIALLRRIIQDEERHVENWQNALTSLKA